MCVKEEAISIEAWVSQTLGLAPDILLDKLFSERLFIGCVLLDPTPDKPELFSDNAKDIYKHD